MLQVIERIWKHGGLDLRLSCYSCLPTGHKEGLIQMVPQAETICRIQMQARDPSYAVCLLRIYSGNSPFSPLSLDNPLYSYNFWLPVSFLKGQSFLFTPCSLFIFNCNVKIHMEAERFWVDICIDFSPFELKTLKTSFQLKRTVSVHW
jgi:hypothetical protein